MLTSGVIERDRLLALFEAIVPDLHRYPALDSKSFRRSLENAVARS